MRKITLICSVHRQHGLCNVEELLKILRAIKPEVVFEELRPSEFDFYYAQGTLETHAIKKYREFGTFQEVAVDRYDTTEMENLHDEMQRVFEYVDRTSRDYQELRQVEDENKYRHGYRYLNSIVCEKLTAKLREIEDKTLAGSGNQGSLSVLEKWRHVSRRRELEMVGNIYEYSKDHVFDTGVFLVGSDHKAGIVREIEKYAPAEAGLITWNFAYGQNL